MGNICPHKNGEGGGYKNSGNREHVYKLGIQKGGLENGGSNGNGITNGNGHHYPLMGMNGNGSVNGATNGSIMNGIGNGKQS
jgi:hypothetical protein